MPSTIPTLHPVAVQLRAVQDELSAFFKERRTCIEAITLALLVAEHAFILGPPGTGKSFLIRCFVGRFRGAKYFEQLLSKTLPAEAVLGPYDIPGLRDRGEMHRKYNGFLPTADIAMLDEIGKMSPTLGHNLLAALNERVLHQVNGGRSTVDLPLISVFGGSNELPTDESDDAAACYDRLLVRVVVQPIQEMGNLISVLSGPKGPPAGTEIDWADVLDVIKNVVPAVTIPTDVWEVVAKLIESLKAVDMRPSDRRLMQAAKLMQANAFMKGRTEVTTDDVEVLKHALWENPSQISTVERLTLSVSNPIAEKALVFQEQAEEIAAEVRDSKGLALDKRSAIGTELNGRLRSVAANLGKIKQEALAAGASTTKLDEVAARIGAVKAAILKDCLDIDIASLR